jgi:hypothetical protein
MTSFVQNTGVRHASMNHSPSLACGRDKSGKDLWVAVPCQPDDIHRRQRDNVTGRLKAKAPPRPETSR